MTTEHRRSIQGAAWLNVAVGLLVLLTPFWTGDYTADRSTAPMWSAVLTGSAVALLAGFNAVAAQRRHTERAYGPAVVNVFLGLWVLVSPFLYDVTAAYTASMVVYGLVLVVAAGYNTWAASDARRHERRAHA